MLSNLGFIRQTARDYHLDYEIVEMIYNDCGGDAKEFYKQLENRIKERSNE